MCIYLTHHNGLHYEKVEHIIPAGIGGIRTLAKGVVSDEFNEAMSGLEKDYMDHSIYVGLARLAVGPGKRGSLSPAKQTRSNVQVMCSEAEPGTARLGYLQKGKSYQLPQFTCSLSSQTIAIHFNKEAGHHHGDQTEALIRVCKAIRDIHITLIESTVISTDKLIFGYLKEKKQIRGFIARHPQGAIHFSPELIEFIGDRLKPDISHGQSNGSAFRFNIPGMIKPEYDRVHAKIAFNYLANLHGAEFVQHACFDGVRRWIVNGGMNQYTKLELNQASAAHRLIKRLPDMVHAVMISQRSGYIAANLVIYRHWVVHITLTRTAPISHHPQRFDGLVCDWSNRNETDIKKLLLFV